MLPDKSKSIVNERAMSQHVQSLKQLCIKMNHHLKKQPSMSEVCPNVEYRVEWLCLLCAISEATVSQNKPSSQKSTIDEWSVSQCRISSIVTISPKKCSLKWLCPSVGSSHNSQTITIQVKKWTNYAAMQGIIPKEIVIDEWGMPQCRSHHLWKSITDKRGMPQCKSYHSSSSIVL